MRTIVKGKNIDVPESVREYAERKMRRLERFLDERSDAVVELSTEQHRSTADSQIVAVTLVMTARRCAATPSGPTYQASLDIVIDRIERQAVDCPREAARQGPAGSGPRRVAADRGGRRGAEDGAGRSQPRGGPSRASSRRSDSPSSRCSRRTPLARMEELGHLFFIFVNAESEKVCVLYKRRAGDYGLIEPMIGGEYTPGRSGRKG